MAGEMRELGVDQGLESGSLGNHLAEDGSNVMEAERMTTVGEDLREFSPRSTARWSAWTTAPTAFASAAASRSTRSGWKRSPTSPTASSARSFLEREQALRSGR